MDLIVLCERNQEARVLSELRSLGNFRSSGFRDVLMGQVEDLEGFLEKLHQLKHLPITRAIPLDQSFHFSPQNLMGILKQRVERYLDKIDPNESFCVRMDRRGFKGVISSREIERELGAHLWELLRRKHGSPPKVDLEDPDKLITIQSVGNFCGLGLIPKQLRQRYYLIRIK